MSEREVPITIAQCVVMKFLTNDNGPNEIWHRLHAQYGESTLSKTQVKWGNAPAQSSFLVCNFLAKNETTVVPQPPYSPDLAPVDFFPFPKLKSTLKGCRFDTSDEIQ